MGILVKPHKELIFVFDGSHKVDAYAVPVNDWTDVSVEFGLLYGTCLQRQLVWIWNLRISYPWIEIFLWDNDGSGALKNAKYHPDVALAFAFRIGSILCLPTGVCIVGNTSSNSWEVIAWARPVPATTFFSRTDLVHTHKEFLDKVRYEGGDTLTLSIIQARSDSLNKGAYSESGQRLPSQHNTFVDDNLMADVADHIRHTIVASIEALFILLRRPDTHERRLALSLEMFIKSACSYKRVQLGILINTRDMTVSIPPDKRQALWTELQHWHKHRKQANLRKFAILMGTILHLSTICHWDRYLVSELQQSSTVALKINKNHISLSTDYIKLLALIREETNKHGDVASPEVAFMSNRVSKKIWSCSVPLFFTRELMQDIGLLSHIFASPETFFWGMPIGHVIPRDASYSPWGDSSVASGGGFSPCLRFWWFIDWPPEIRWCTIRFLTFLDWGRTSLSLSMHSNL